MGDRDRSRSRSRDREEGGRGEDRRAPENELGKLFIGNLSYDVRKKNIFPP